MKSLTRNGLCALMMASGCYVSTAWAAASTLTGEVTKVMVTSDDMYGGCMAAFSVSPTTKLPSCAHTWLTFSCNGEFTDAIRGYRMLDQAQLALAAAKTVTVHFTDSQIRNGYCFATRIDVNK